MSHCQEVADIRDRTPFLVLAIYFPELSKDVLGKLFLHSCLDAERLAPAQSRDEHVLCLLGVEISAQSTSVFAPMLERESEAYLARRNFISRTLTRASLAGASGSIETPHILYGLDAASSCSGKASLKVSDRFD